MYVANAVTKLNPSLAIIASLIMTIKLHSTRLTLHFNASEISSTLHYNLLPAHTTIVTYNVSMYFYTCYVGRSLGTDQAQVILAYITIWVV